MNKRNGTRYPITPNTPSKVDRRKLPTKPQSPKLLKNKSTDIANDTIIATSVPINAPVPLFSTGSGAWLARLRLPVPFAVPFPDEAFFFPPLFFSFSVSSAFFAAGDFLDRPAFFSVPAVSPARSVLCLFLLVSATCLMPPIFPMYLRFPLFHKIQPPADCFSHFSFLLSHSVYPNSGKKATLS